MSDTMTCEQCGNEFTAASELKGLCPTCLMGKAFPEVSEAIDASLPRRGSFIPPTVNDVADHFDQLEVLELIGHGGMSAVYKARQKQLDRVVALKLLPEEVAETTGGITRFQREAKTLAQLDHPNIVRVYDAGHAGPWCYFLMEYVGGPSLRQLLGNSRLPPNEVLRIVPDVCDGLQYAHDRGVLHRDIKPENILIDDLGRARIVDFGIAKLLAEPDSDQRATASSHVLGTPNYLAPEQIQTPADIDHRADLYSVGVLIYEMLTGELPIGNFHLPSATANTNPNLDSVVMRALAKERSRRYESAHALSHDLVNSSSEQASTGRSVDVGELVLTLLSIAAFAIGCTTAIMAYGELSEASRTLMFAQRRGDLPNEPYPYMSSISLGFVSIVSALVSFILARVNTSSARRRHELSRIQHCCYPIVILGAASVLVGLVLVPAICIVAYGGIPLIVDVQYWSVFGAEFGEAAATSMLTEYWLRVIGLALSASAIWSTAVALIVHYKPSLLQILVHPASPSGLRAISRSLAVLGLAILLPFGVTLFCVSDSIPSPF